MLKQQQKIHCFVCPHICRQVFNNDRSAEHTRTHTLSLAFFMADGDTVSWPPLPPASLTGGQRAYCHTCLHLLSVTVGNLRAHSNHCTFNHSSSSSCSLLSHFYFTLSFTRSFPSSFSSTPSILMCWLGFFKSIACTYRAALDLTPGTPDRRKSWTDYKKYSLWFTQRLRYFKTYFITFMTVN